VILLIGDGMGVSEVTAARYYQYGAAGRMQMDRLPSTGYQTTWSLKPGFAPYKVDYDPDSTATATMYVENAAQLEGVKSGKPVLGLFNGGNMTTEWTGPIATLGDGVPAHRCTTTNRPAPSRACRR